VHCKGSRQRKSRKAESPEGGRRQGGSGAWMNDVLQAWPAWMADMGGTVAHVYEQAYSLSALLLSLGSGGHGWDSLVWHTIRDHVVDAQVTM
jgi:hypothetical protein